MAKMLDGRQAVPLEDVVLAQAFQLETLMNVLERQGLLKKAEVLEEIKRLSATSPTSR
jgi:hypothetical protein